MGLRAFWTEFKSFAFKGNMIDLAVAVVIGAAFSGVINSLVADVIMPAITYVTTAASQATERAKEAVGPPPKPASRPAVIFATPEEQANATALLATVNQEIEASKTPLVKADESISALQKMKAGMPWTVQHDINQTAAKLKAVQLASTPVAAPAPPAPASTDQKPVNFDWTIGRIKIGNFVGALINFVLIALAVFVTIVKLVGTVMKRVGPKESPAEPVTKECPFCLSIIPIKARKCSHCTADLPEAATA